MPEANVAVTFADWRDLQRWKLIDAALGLSHPEPAEIYSTSELLYGQLRIPPSATGTLPQAMRERAGLDAEAVEDIGETGRARTRGKPEPERANTRLRRRTRSGRPVRDGTAERPVRDGAAAPRAHEASARGSSGGGASGRGAREVSVTDPSAGEPGAREGAAAPGTGTRQASGGNSGRTRRRRRRGRGNSAAAQ